MKSVKVALNRARVPKQAGDLAKALNDNPSTNSIKVEDIYLPLNHLFNVAAKRAFENKVDRTVIERKIKHVTTTQYQVIDQVRYFGAMAIGERKIFEAAQKVANQINQYANQGFVTGVLCRLLMCQLVTEPFQLERYMIMSYVALSPEGIKYLTEWPTKVEFEVGGVPLNSEDL